MSTTPSIAVVTAGIVSTLERSIARPEGQPAPEISAAHPATAGPINGTAGLTVFCYRVREDDSHRRLRQDGPSLVVELSFLIAARGDESTLEPQRLLSAAAVALHRNPILALPGPDGSTPVPVQLVSEAITLEALAAMWTALAVPWQLCLTYAARGLVLDGGPGGSRPELLLTPRVRS
jgi:hypothetical protein